MEETIKLVLEEVNSNLKELSNLQKGSDEYGNVVTDTGKLLEKVTPMIKIKEEAEERAKNRKEDLDIQERIRKEEAEERAKIREEEFEYKEKVRLDEREYKEQVRKDEKLEREQVRKEEFEYKEEVRKDEKLEREQIREDEFTYKERIRREEAAERAEVREEDREERKSNRRDDKYNSDEKFKIETFIEVTKIVVPLLTSALLLKHDDRLSIRLLKFEETGSVTNTVGRNFFSSIGRRKR